MRKIQWNSAASVERYKWTCMPCCWWVQCRCPHVHLVQAKIMRKSCYPCLVIQPCCSDWMIKTLQSDGSNDANIINLGWYAEKKCKLVGFVKAFGSNPVMSTMSIQSVLDIRWLTRTCSMNDFQSWSVYVCFVPCQTLETTWAVRIQYVSIITMIKSRSFCGKCFSWKLKRFA